MNNSEKPYLEYAISYNLTGGVQMIAPATKPTVKLIDQDGNAFSILGRVKKALLIGGADKEYIDRYLSEATSGDYDHLLSVTMEYVDVD